jgi:hypothetical protein
MFSRMINKEPDIDCSIIIHTHIPRTAGTSFVNLLKLQYGNEAVLYDGDPVWQKFDSLELNSKDLLRYKAVSGHFCYGIHLKFSKCPLYIATVRDPIDRTASAIRFIRENKDHYLNPILGGLNYDQSLSALIELKEFRLIGRQCEFLSQLDDFTHARRVIDKSYYMVAPVERYADLITLLECFIFKAKARVANENVSNKSTEEFSFSSLANIRDIAMNDFLLVEYVRKSFAEKYDYLLNKINSKESSRKNPF